MDLSHISAEQELLRWLLPVDGVPPSLTPGDLGGRADITDWAKAEVY